MSTYSDVISAKQPRVETCGIDPRELHALLYPFQRDITAWSVRLGRAAIFADTGMGKTLMQLEWARHFAGRALIVAPIGVAEQTIAEGQRIGIGVNRVREPSDIREGVSITNYERLHKFIGTPLDAIVLDEASILKSVDGKTRTMLIREFAKVPRRLCCTATPAPNDVTELANYAEFLGVMSRVEMLATFFVHDSDEAVHGGWRLKGHAAEAMYRWMATWAVYVRRPSDLGHSDEGFNLPPLEIRDEVVPANWRPEGQLFATNLGGVGQRAQVRRHTIEARVARAVEIIRGTQEQWLVWAGLNDEQDAIARALGDDCTSIQGKDDEDTKIAREQFWRADRVRILVTKPDIFGWGMNWQHCRRMLFLGIGDSYEAYYQAIRRCWRHGQKRDVDVRIVVSDAEGVIAANVRAKEDTASRTAEGVVAAMREAQTEAVRGKVAGRDEYRPALPMLLPRWMRGDACPR